MRDPTPYGMHVGKAAASEQPLWPPAAADVLETDQAQAPVPAQGQRASDAPQQPEGVLFDAALEEFL